MLIYMNMLYHLNNLNIIRHLKKHVAISIHVRSETRSPLYKHHECTIHFSLC